MVIHSARNTAPTADAPPPPISSPIAEASAGIAIDEPIAAGANVTPDRPASESSPDNRLTPVVRTTAGALSQEIALAAIRPSPTNPRTTFDPDAMAALTASVAEHGVLEPVVVRRRPDAHTAYELIAGERRWRAAQAAGLATIPCRVTIGIDDRQALTLQALENLQRADLNPVEEATTFRQLSDAGLTQSAIAKTVGKSQPYVANRLRLLDLPSDVLDLIRSGALTAAHGISLARFSGFPAIVSVMAAETVKTNQTSKDLDRHKVPHAYELKRRKLIADIGQYGAHAFDRSVWQQCPYNAYRGNDTYERWCLRPEHADELTAAANAAREAAAADTIAAVEAASPDGAALRTDTLPRDAYTQVFEHNRPPGCTGDCPCARTALQPSYDGTLVTVEICTDPSRFATLRENGFQQAIRERQAVHDAHHARLLPVISTASLDSRALAVVLVNALHDVSREVLAAAAERQTGSRAAPPPPADRWRPEAEQDRASRAILDGLAALPPEELLRFALDALLSDEMHDRYILRRQSSTPVADWYLGDAPPPSDDPSSDDEDAYPRESDVLCSRCDCPILVSKAATDEALARHHLAGGASYCGDCEFDTAALDPAP